jgi:hypothetical protein
MLPPLTEDSWDPNLLRGHRHVEAGVTKVVESPG